MPSHTCPSAPGRPGTTLLGVVGPRGSVAYLTPPITVDEAFMAAARRGRSPEKRFRFAGPCVEDRCAKWTGSRCGVIDVVLAADGVAAAGDSVSLPRCAIRSSCRWFAQSGTDACTVCPLVITDCR